MNVIHLALVGLLVQAGLASFNERADQPVLMRRHPSAAISHDRFDADEAAADALLHGILGQRSDAPEVAALLETSSIEGSRKKKRLAEVARWAVRQELSALKRHLEPGADIEEAKTPPSLLEVDSTEQKFADAIRHAAHKELADFSSWVGVDDHSSDKKEEDSTSKQESQDLFSTQGVSDLATRQAQWAIREANEVNSPLAPLSAIHDSLAGLEKVDVSASDSPNMPSGFAEMNEGTTGDSTAQAVDGAEFQRAAADSTDQHMDSSDLLQAEHGDLSSMKKLSEVIKARTTGGTHQKFSQQPSKHNTKADEVLNDVINWNKAESKWNAPAEPPLSPALQLMGEPAKPVLFEEEDSKPTDEVFMPAPANSLDPVPVMPKQMDMSALQAMSDEADAALDSVTKANIANDETA